MRDEKVVIPAEPGWTVEWTWEGSEEPSIGYVVAWRINVGGGDDTTTGETTGDPLIVVDQESALGAVFCLSDLGGPGQGPSEPRLVRSQP